MLQYQKRAWVAPVPVRESEYHEQASAVLSTEHWRGNVLAPNVTAVETKSCVDVNTKAERKGMSSNVPGTTEDRTRSCWRSLVAEPREPCPHDRDTNPRQRHCNRKTWRILLVNVFAA